MNMKALASDHNQFAYSVSEISSALKRTVEEQFGQVRVRGEISGWKVATSGHAYLKLKDDGAVLDAVCWKGTLNKMAFKPQDGIEVICSGRITTYPGRSNYQIVIDSLEPAGAGALMALLEKRRQMLQAEGLFHPERKKPLPFMPRVIGVITSPTGAVIRDILHRLSDRFPCHVLVWPVAVQGESAAEQVARAIAGFNALTGDSIPRPDLLIVARGGGSLEDLWPFNEEIVVRTVAASDIPVISAIGHETDTTLIDHASDHRAPTPTAAAEIAVPVRQEWLLAMLDFRKRITSAHARGLAVRSEQVTGLARGLAHPKRSLEQAMQKLDDWSERLQGAVPALFDRKAQALVVAQARLRPLSLSQTIERHGQDIAKLRERALRVTERFITERARMLASVMQLLESLNYTRVLERGFTLVRDAQDKVITRSSAMSTAPHRLIFFDGETWVKAE